MDWQSMLFQDWQGIARTVVVGIFAYTVLVAFLRISGKRTLAKLNAFDLVVTVALGSTLSAILLQESIALAEGAVALALLIAMQFLVTFTSVRWQGFADAVRSQPTLLVRNGEFCDAALRSERVTHDEALGAVRSAGGSRMEDVAFVILESDGTMSVSLRRDVPACSRKDRDDADGVKKVDGVWRRVGSPGGGRSCLEADPAEAE